MHLDAKEEEKKKGNLPKKTSDFLQLGLEMKHFWNETDSCWKSVDVGELKVWAAVVGRQNVSGHLTDRNQRAFPVSRKASAPPHPPTGPQGFLLWIRSAEMMD